MNWMPISNDLIHNDLSEITHKGFAIISYLTIDSTTRDYTKTSILDIQKNCSFKDVRTVRKYLKPLMNKYLIADVDIDSINKHYLFEIKIPYKKVKKFEIIPSSLFENYINKIDSLGWSLLCTLAVYYNNELGVAYPNYTQLQNNLGISHGTLSKYLRKLEDNKLINIKQQEVYVENDIYKFGRNHYEIKFMTDKKFLKFKQSFFKKRML